ncbi:MAG: ABC transporter permease [Pseudomonadales bacterium]
MQTISWAALGWCLVPVVLVTAIFWRWSGSAKEPLLASARMLVQLIAVGYLLVLIFAQPALWVSILVLLVMLIAASWISIRPVKKHPGVILPALVALLFSVAIHLGISIGLVLDVKPWFDSQVLIPLAGMYFANTMTAISLAAERFYAELESGKQYLAARNTAFDAAMIPQINALLAVGLVALPGMMTGQILSGVSPLIAVRYQIMIMAMILGSAGVGTALLLWQLIRSKTAHAI